MPTMSITAAAVPTPRRWPALQTAVAAWLCVAMVGQLIFAAYIVGFYGGGALSGQMERWNQVTRRGWVAGDTLGNAVFASHVLFTVLIVVGALIQLLPPLRRRAPLLHRWNGRAYLLTAAVLALGGVMMMLTRGTPGAALQKAGTLLNALVILFCGAMAWRHARARRFDVHRRWALRLFLAVSGVWFFRIGLMAWLLIFRAPVGFDPKTFTGPFLTALAYAQFVLPLLVLELVFHAQAQPQRAGLRRATTALVVVLTGFTALGIVGATLRLWLPRL